MRVLVIDDEPDVLLLCKVNFEFAGHEVLEAPDGEKGIEVAASEHPDLIVLDLMLPNRDGISVLEELGTRFDTREVPVVLLTAKAQAQDQLRGWEAGASEYVTKPFSPITLTDLVQRVIQMSPEERRRRREQALGDLTGRK